MDTPRPYKRIAIFLAGLVAVFAAAVALGSLVGPAETEGDGTEEAMEAHAMETQDAHGATQPAGLGIADDGYALRMTPQQTLAADLFVSGGEFEARSFPAPRPVYETEGYEVRLDAGDPVAGEPAGLDFTVSRDGRPVEDLAPYLGAKGHLVALREGDLAFLHVHPDEDHEVAAEEIEFAATFPTAGRYRLYLQFKHEGVVQTAQFTVVVPR